MCYKYFGALHLAMTESEQRVIPSQYLSGAAKRNEESVVRFTYPLIHLFT